MALCHMKRRVATATDMYDTVVVAHSLVTMRTVEFGIPTPQRFAIHTSYGRGVLVQKMQ